MLPNVRKDQEHLLWREHHLFLRYSDAGAEERANTSERDIWLGLSRRLPYCNARELCRIRLQAHPACNLGIDGPKHRIHLIVLQDIQDGSSPFRRKNAAFCKGLLATRFVRMTFMDNSKADCRKDLHDPCLLLACYH